LLVIVVVVVIVGVAKVMTAVRQGAGNVEKAVIAGPVEKTVMVLSCRVRKDEQKEVAWRARRTSSHWST